MRQLTPRQAKFVDGVVAGKSATAAYLDAFQCTPDSANAQGSRLLADIGVAAAIEAQREAIRNEIRVSRKDVVEGLLEIARDMDAPAAARVPAWMGVAKVLGFLVDKQEITTKLYVIEAPARAADVKTWEAEAERLTGGG